MSFFRSGGHWALRFQLAASVGGLPTAAVGSEHGPLDWPAEALHATLTILPRIVPFFQFLSNGLAMPLSEEGRSRSLLGGELSTAIVSQPLRTARGGPLYPAKRIPQRTDECWISGRNLLSRSQSGAKCLIECRVNAARTSPALAAGNRQVRRNWRVRARHVGPATERHWHWPGPIAANASTVSVDPPSRGSGESASSFAPSPSWAPPAGNRVRSAAWHRQRRCRR